MDRPRRLTLVSKRRKPDPIEPASQAELAALDDEPRPATRSDCADGPRPCPFVSCRHHLYLDVNQVTGALRFTFPDSEVHQLEETCSLDVAEWDGATLEQVGHLIGLTRERIRQIEVRGLVMLRASPPGED